MLIFLLLLLSFRSVRLRSGLVENGMPSTAPCEHLAIFGSGNAKLASKPCSGNDTKEVTHNGTQSRVQGTYCVNVSDVATSKAFDFRWYFAGTAVAQT